MYTVKLNKCRSTWNYFTENPQGGGFGSNYCGPRYIALHKATMNIPEGSEYQLIVNDKNQGIHTKRNEQ